MNRGFNLKLYKKYANLALMYLINKHKFQLKVFFVDNVELGYSKRRIFTLTESGRNQRIHINDIYINCYNHYAKEEADNYAYLTKTVRKPLREIVFTVIHEFGHILLADKITEELSSDDAANYFGLNEFDECWKNVRNKVYKEKDERRLDF